MTQQSFSPEEAQKRFESLPPEVKKMLYSPEMMSTLKQVSEKHQLHIDQLGLLEAETSAVMLGFTETKDFPQMLVGALRVDSPNASAIAQDVSSLLFEKIRNSMKSVDTQTLQTPAPSTQTPAAAAPGVQKPPPALTSLAHKLPMPPAVSTPAPATPSMKPSTPAASPPPPAAKPQVPLAPHPHDLKLVEKTITTPATPPKTAPTTPAATTGDPSAPQKPANYPADPYREPVEPQ